jgi:hypothetical protein
MSVFPETARWWLEYYRDFAEELRQDYGEIVDAAGRASSSVGRPVADRPPARVCGEIPA